MFLVIKQMESIRTDNLINTCQIIFSEYGLPSKIDAGINFVSKTF